MNRHPPRAAALLLQLALPTTVAEGLLGDLHEEFLRLVERDGVRAARRWYWREACRATLSFSPLAEPDAPGPVARGDGPMWDALADARFALRSLATRPGFAVVTITTLALGIGATSAIFSAVNPILFQPLPYPHPDRVTTVWELDKDGSRSNFGFPTYVDLRDRNHTFSAMAAIGGWGPTLTGQGDPELVVGQRVSQSYFTVLGIAPALGRDFRPEEDVVGAPRVVILSHELWRARFHGDSSIVGKPINLSGTLATVVGVMPAGFQNLMNPVARIWTPLRYGPSLPYACRDCRHLRVIGRLKPGVAPATALKELQGLQRAIVAEHPREYPSDGVRMIGLREYLTAAVRPALLAVLGAVALVLLVACANVTNLLLARGARRRGEYSVRIALGASRGRLMRQVLTESLVLASLGGIGGTAIAVVGVRLLARLSPQDLPRHQDIHASGALLLFGIALTLVVGLLAGAVPAWHATRANLHEGIKLTGRRSAGSSLTRGGLVVAEVALALMLLIGSGLMLRSSARLFAVSPGFRVDHLLTMQVQAASSRFTNDSITRRYFDEVIAAVRRLPGVTAAALTSQLPLSDDFDSYGIHSDINPDANPADDPSAFRYGVTPGYIETMGIRVLRGRSLRPEDREGQVRVALMNRSAAARAFPGVDPLGRRFRVGDPAQGNWFTVVGIVDDVHQVSLASEDVDAIYAPESQWMYADGAMSLVVRTSGDPEAMADAVRRAVWSVDPDEPIVRVATMATLLADTAANRRFVLLLFEGFALVALLLAAAGIYGVMSGAVAERLRELGVRSALGASRPALLALVMRQGLRLTALGVGIGLAVAIGASGVLGSLLFEVSRVDGATYAAVVLLLVVVAALACGIPAWRASRVDPAVTLRAE